MLHFRMDMPLYLMAFYGSVMILIVLIFRILLRNRVPKFVFPVLWSIVVIRLLVPFSLSSPISAPVPDWSFMQQETASSVATESTAPLSEAVQTGYATEVTESSDSSAAFNSGTASTSGMALTSLPWIGFFPVIYLLGIAVTAFVLLCQKRRYSHKLRDSFLVEHNETINGILRNMSMGHVLVFTNDHIASPLVSGILNKHIYLPSGMDFQNIELLEHILTHETMHIRRRDNLVKTAMLLTICLHWYNPLVWLMSKYLSADMEAACDAAVLRNIGQEKRQSYAGSLLSMAITGNRQSLLYSAFSKTEVERRIQSILYYKKTTALVLALSLLFLFSSTLVFATGGQAPFSDYLSSYCGSSNSKWAIRAVLTRDIALGENSNKRADDIILDVLVKDTTKDPEILQSQITTALAREFGVEKSAFQLSISLSLSDEELEKEYSAHGITKGQDDFYLYQGEAVRFYNDPLLNSMESRMKGTVDITILRDRLGQILSIDAVHKGDKTYDLRTEKLRRQHDLDTVSSGTASTAAEEATVAGEQ